MIPIRDTISTRNYPVVNNTIIGINVVVFILQMMQGPELDRFIYIYGLVPARYSVGQIASYFTPGQQIFSIVSFMFLHGGFLHLIGNMWFLYIFGDNIEDRLGHMRYIVFYLLCGMASGISHLLLNLNSNVPTIGASGAIAGVMGAYFILHPRSKILTLIPIIIIPWLIEIPAFFFLGLWFVLQFINATVSHGDVSGIAWWAHIGGFVFGIFFLKLFLLLPSVGVTERMRPVTEKKKTHRLQVIRPVAPGNESNLYGTITITPFEALVGTSKMVNIPWGFHKRLVRVLVPPGIKEDTKLRLKGLGRLTTDGQKGDLFLKVVFKS